MPPFISDFFGLTPLYYYYYYTNSAKSGNIFVIFWLFHKFLLFSLFSFKMCIKKNLRRIIIVWQHKLTTLFVRLFVSNFSTKNGQTGGMLGGMVWVQTWVYSGCSGFLPQSKDMQVRLSRDSKLLVGVNGCLFLRVSLSRMYPTSRPLSAEIDSSPPMTLQRISRYS